jgi:hypothetical protein
MSFARGWLQPFVVGARGVFRSGLRRAAGTPMEEQRSVASLWRLPAGLSEPFFNLNAIINWVPNTQPTLQGSRLSDPEFCRQSHRPKTWSPLALTRRSARWRHRVASLAVIGPVASNDGRPEGNGSLHRLASADPSPMWATGPTQVIEQGSNLEKWRFLGIRLITISTC